VKKYFLFISLLAYFFPAVAGAGKASFHTPCTSCLVETNAFTILTAEYPHSEFEVNSRTVFANSNFRQQSSPGFIDASEAGVKPFHQKGLPNRRNTFHISSKQYLLHIYPSHNFW